MLFMDVISVLHQFLIILRRNKWLFYVDFHCYAIYGFFFYVTVWIFIVYHSMNIHFDTIWMLPFYSMWMDILDSRSSLIMCGAKCLPWTGLVTLLWSAVFLIAFRSCSLVKCWCWKRTLHTIGCLSPDEKNLIPPNLIKFRKIPIMVRCYSCFLRSTPKDLLYFLRL